MTTDPAPLSADALAANRKRLHAIRDSLLNAQRYTDADAVRDLLAHADALAAELERWRPRRPPALTPEERAEHERRFRERFPDAKPGTYGMMDFQKIDDPTPAARSSTSTGRRKISESGAGAFPA